MPQMPYFSFNTDSKRQNTVYSPNIQDMIKRKQMDNEQNQRRCAQTAHKMQSHAFDLIRDYSYNTPRKHNHFSAVPEHDNDQSCL